MATWTFSSDPPEERIRDPAVNLYLATKKRPRETASYDASPFAHPHWRNGRVRAACLASGQPIPDNNTDESSYSFQRYSSAMLLLHEEILDFAAFMTPTPSERAIAEKALEVVHTTLIELFPEARLEVFGSRANGLVLPTSDWDLVIFNVTPSLVNMRRIANEFEARGLVKKTDVISTARVPIVKLWEKQSGIQIDLSFEAKSAILSRALTAEYIAQFPALRPLILVLKYFLVQRGLNDTYSGGVGSFLLLLMVVHVVQERQKSMKKHSSTLDSTAGATSTAGTSAKDKQKNDISFSSSSSTAAVEPTGKGKKRKLASSSAAAAADDSVVSIAKGKKQDANPLSATSSSSTRAADIDNSMNLGSLLMTLFELFGWNLNMRTTGISVRGKSGGGYYSKEGRGWFNPMRPALLSLENPCEPETDVGRNSWGIDKVRRALRTAHASLSHAVRSWIKDIGQAQPIGRGGTSRTTPTRSLLSTIVVPDQLLADREAEILAQLSKFTRSPIFSGPAALSSSSSTSTEIGAAGASSVCAAGSTVHNEERPPGVDIEEGETDDLPILPPKSKRFKSATKEDESKNSSKLVGVKPLDIVGTASVLGRTLRHGRLMADLMTRKERNVEELNAAPPGFY